MPQSNADPSPLRVQAQLNLDILRLVCDYIDDIPDVLSFGLTCSALTEDAIRRRLKMAPVDLWKRELVDSFHTFIFSNEQARAPCIYGLKIRTVSDYDLRYTSESDFEATSNRLIAIVKAATRIQYLDFNASVSDSLLNAMVKLTTVRELRVFTDVSTDQELFLEHLAVFRSPLTSLLIAGSDLVESHMLASFLHDRLSHLAPTLEFLDLEKFPIDISPSSVSTQFAAVRSLKLQTCFASDCDLLGVLGRLFPKLNNTLELGSLYASIMGDDIPAFRERCVEAQKRYRWSGLDRLICDADTAYFLALSCPIRRMDVKVGPPHAASYLAEALSLSCPKYLHAADLRMTHLVVFADIQICHGRRSSRRSRGNNVHSNRIVNRLLGSIKHLRLTHLRIVFRYSNYLTARKTVPYADSVSDIGDGMDLELMKARFVDTMPTLRYLFLTTGGQTYIPPREAQWSEYGNEMLNKWLSSKAWSVVHDNEDINLGQTNARPSGRCIELSVEAEERIAQEELQLSHDEEEDLRECSSSQRQSDCSANESALGVGLP